MKITPIFRARIVESSTKMYTSNRLLLPPKKISIALEGRTGAQHIICHLHTANYRNYFRKHTFVYLECLPYRDDAKHGRVSPFYQFEPTERGMEYGNPLGRVSHPTFSLDFLEQEFEKFYSVDLFRPSKASFEFGMPTSRGVICDSDENATLVVLSQ